MKKGKNHGAFINRIGKEYFSNEGFWMKIIADRGTLDCDVQFSDGVIVTNKTFNNIKLGQISHPNFKSFYGVGYKGIGDYALSINGKKTKSGSIWESMMTRCYNPNKLKNPSYKDCTIDERFHCFQDFAKWFEENWNPLWEGRWELDKDILQKGNKIYSPETCCFVPCEINSQFKKSKDNGFPTNISFNKIRNKFAGNIRIDGKNYTTYKDTIEEVFDWLKPLKEDKIKNLAHKYEHQLTDQCYQALINWTIEITD